MDWEKKALGNLEMVSENTHHKNHLNCFRGVALLEFVISDSQGLELA